MSSFYRTLITLLLLLNVSVPALAGGVSVGATRIIYPANNKEITFSVKNSDNNNVFLIQTWAEDEAGNKTKNFIITPPLFVVKPQKENTLRIMYAGPPLKQDRESLFWLTVKAIPESGKSAENTLKLAIASRLKMFYRPGTLKGDSNDAWRSLKFTRQGASMSVSNPTPYYVTLSNLSLNGKKIANFMVPPMGTHQVKLPDGKKGTLRYQTINDYGANTTVQSQNI